ncbi:unnamed protein product [Anisakis simplex]|uniref:ANK_REP_REGION domain-containing protein n=1 Tax=Anisakis simplex TaxID=6269 RepID=A0A0M3JQL3_ANISI|nr:unnamed protein product [Anisakis simplex]
MIGIVSSEDENGTLRSRAVEYLAQHGSFEILNALKEWDAKHTDSQSALVHFTYDNDNPLVGVIEHWIRFGEHANTLNSANTKLSSSHR